MSDSENEGSLFSHISEDSFSDQNEPTKIIGPSSTKIGKAESINSADSDIESDPEADDVEGDDDEGSIESAQHMTKSKTGIKKDTKSQGTETDVETEPELDEDDIDLVESIENIKVSEKKIDPSTLIIAKNNRTTSRIMTLYELSAIIGTRATQIDEGSPIFVEYSDLVRSDYMAIREILQKKCPLSIHRQTRRGVEYWEVNEMIIPSSYNIPTGII